MKFFSGLSQIGDLLKKKRFFLLTQKIAYQVIPSRWVKLKKSAYFVTSPHLRSHNAEAKNDLNIYRGTRESVSRIVHDLYANSPATLAFYEKFFDDGIQVWIAELQDRVVGVVWLYQGYYLSAWQGYDAFVLRLEVEPTAYFACNIYVDESCRGQRIMANIMECIFADFNEDTIYYSCIDEGNFSSIRAHEKLGFQRCGATYYLQFFRWVWTLSFSRTEFPKLFRIPRGKTIPVILSHKD